MPGNNFNVQRAIEQQKKANGVKNGTIERKAPKPTEEDLVKMEAMRIEKKAKAKANALKKERERAERNKKLANAEQFFEEAKAAGLLDKKIPKFIKSLYTSKRTTVC